jgi:hypothetical protein
MSPGNFRRIRPAAFEAYQHVSAMEVRHQRRSPDRQDTAGSGFDTEPYPPGAEGSTTVTAASLVTAVTVGLVIGVLARWRVPVCRGVPFWLPSAAGVGAAVLGTVGARLAGVDTSQVSPVELILQVTLGGLGVAAVVRTAGRQMPPGRPDKPGEHR